MTGVSLSAWDHTLSKSQEGWDTEIDEPSHFSLFILIPWYEYLLVTFQLKALLVSVPLMYMAVNFLCIDIARWLTIPASAVKL